ncbi:iron ABC transporter substrate-binding protein, partial [bacterium]
MRSLVVRSAIGFFGLLVALPTLSSCTQEPANRVVLYCSVDDVFSKPIIAQLEKETGLDIEPLFDVESAKAAGLANRLRGEHNRPRADVFWASTVLQSQLLAKENILASYVSPSAADIPKGFKDPEGRWTAMGVRARVLISSKPSNEKSLAFVPKDLKGRFAIANPQFGTTSDWAAAYGARWGTKRTETFFGDLKKAGVRILPGNADVASAVADGNLLY